MKLLLICIPLTLAVIVQAQSRLQHAIALQCVKQVGIDKSVIEKAMDTLILPDDKKYKEFLTCSYKKQGFQDEKGNISIKNIKTFLSNFYNASDLTILDICGKVKGESDAELAFNALDCILKKLKKMESIPDEE